MLGLLALQSAWNAWAAPPVERDPNEEPAVPDGPLVSHGQPPKGPLHECS
jgi:hypothetical protein